ncbi:MAG: ABC transporter permease subunit [Nocardioides sp.]|uniref:ABC transporter permease n=1 Tax=Nocardioides sp. TaxID=35761 RepID=UPI0039E2AA6B
MRTLTRWSVPAVFYVALVAVWQLAGRSDDPGSVLIPPSVILDTIRERRDALLLVTRTTLVEAGLGFLIGVAAALLLAVVIDRFRLVGEGVYRLALMLYAVPVIAVAAPLAAWLGLGSASKIAVAALASYFPVLVNLTGALRTQDPRIDELGRVLALGYWRRLWSLRAPAALPALLSSFTIAGPAAFLGAIIAEWMGAEIGLGVLLLQAMFNFNVPLLWTVLLVTTLLNGLIVVGFQLLARLCVPWHASGRSAR